jgi:hypothetical protein
MGKGFSERSQMKREAKVAKDKFDEMAPLLNDIGLEGAAIAGGDSNGLYIYAEPDSDGVFGAVFRDEGDIVRYFDPSSELFDLIWDLWKASHEDEKNRFAVMEYSVKDRKVDVHLGYEEDFVPGEYSSDRRQAALDRRYGNKPIIYPPLPEGAYELRE